MSQKKRIAVIGAGISGLGAAFALKDTHQVVLFEAEARLGGHARTVMAGRTLNQPVDTGFLVYNEQNYPHLTALFDELAVPTISSDMTFGVSIDNGGLEEGRIEIGYSSLAGHIAQPGNLLRPGYYRMLRDIMRFNREALALSRRQDGTITDLMDALDMGAWFRDYYLIPMAGAIWSAPLDKIEDFPARALINFLDNHALLQVTGGPLWRTVKGGSRVYVDKMQSALLVHGVEIRLGTPVAGVRRSSTGPEVKTAVSEWEGFDEVVFATHSDQSLGMLCDPSDDEKRHLGAIKFQSNRAVLHSDARCMPTRKAVWSSWVYKANKTAQTSPIGLTYWINRLQSLPMDEHFFVTLNPGDTIPEDKIVDQTQFHHPMFNSDALAAQRDLKRLNGTNNTWFCGAWLKNGFHEDGLASALDVADSINARVLPNVAAQ